LFDPDKFTAEIIQSPQKGSVFLLSPHHAVIFSFPLLIYITSHQNENIPGENMPHAIMLLCLLICLNCPVPAEKAIPALPDMRAIATNTQTGTEMKSAVEIQTTSDMLIAIDTQTATEMQSFPGPAGENLSEPPTFDYKEELKKMGYYKNETEDDRLNLRNAILRFQSSCNLALNGTWDSKCHDIMAFRLATGINDCEDQIKKTPTDGKWIIINKSKRILTLYENTKVIQKYPVAIGNPPSLTPDGMYTVVNKIINPYWGGGGYAKPVKGGVPENPLGYRWLGLSYKDGGTLGIHGNNSPYSIGKNVSHGCIRMINSDVEQLFAVIPLSAPVWIGTDGKLKEWGVVQPEYGTGMETAKAETKKTPAKEPVSPDDEVPSDEIPGAAPVDETFHTEDGNVLPDIIDFSHHKIFSANLQSYRPYTITDDKNKKTA
jgi:hypothetical protein